MFGATVLIQGSDELPITSGSNNPVAAGAVLVALPLLIDLFAVHKQLVSGIALRSTKR